MVQSTHATELGALLTESDAQVLVVAEGSGHVIHLEQPELVTSSIRQTIDSSRE
jgi:pimeloyl-ACP methyl ester carboxylesterase